MQLGTRAVTMPELSEFWKALSEEDKAQLTRELLAWDGESHYIKGGADASQGAAA